MKKIIALVTKIAILSLILVFFSPTTENIAQASSYSSWVQGTDAYKEFYENASLVEREVTEKADPGDESFLVQQLGNLIYWLGAKAQSALDSGTINLTIDGVVFGKLAQPSGISYTSFDLSEGNIYGIIGATLYTVFRGLSFSGFVIVFLILLAKSLISSSVKAKEDLKQGIYLIIINFALVYIMPLAADLVIFLRDQLMYKIASLMLGDGTSILDSMIKMYESDPSLVRAIVYLATVGATIIYIKDYISIAIQQTLLFGFFCVFSLLGTQKKKFLADWASMFFSNMLIPLLDIVCLLLPFMAIDVLTPTGGKMSFAGAIIVMFMIWSARTSRSQLMRLFGNMTGTPVGRGMGGLAVLGMQAVGNMVRMAAATGNPGNVFKGRTNEDSFNAWNEEVARQKDTADEMNRQAGEITKDLPSLETMEGENENKLTNNDYTDEELGVVSAGDMSGGKEDYIAENNADIAEIPINAEDDLGMDADMPSQMEEVPALDEIPENGAVNVIAPEEVTGAGPVPSMSDFEKSRYENLQAMDSLQGEISADQEKLKNMETSSGIADKRAEVQHLEQQSADIDKEIQHHNQKLTDPNVGLSEKSASRQHLNELQVQQREISDKLTTARNVLDGAEKVHREQTAAIRDRISGNEAHLQQRASAERQFAQVSKDHGRDGTRYASAKDMRLAMDTRNANNLRALEAAKNKANMSIKDLRGLSPETAAQVAEMQKDNMRRANLKRAAGKTAIRAASTAVGVATGTAVGLAGAAFTAYGGEDTSSRALAQGAIIGYGVGSGLVKGSVNKVKQVSENREELAANARTAVDTVVKVKNAASNVVNKPAAQSPQRKTLRSVQQAQQAQKRIHIEGKNHTENAANIAYKEIRDNQERIQQERIRQERIQIEGKPNTQNAANIVYREVSDKNQINQHEGEQ